MPVVVAVPVSAGAGAAVDADAVCAGVAGASSFFPIITTATPMITASRPAAAPMIGTGDFFFSRGCSHGSITVASAADATGTAATGAAATGAGIGAGAGFGA